MFKIIKFYSRKISPAQIYQERIKQQKPFNYKEEKPEVKEYVKKEPRDKDEYKLMKCRIIQEVIPQNLQDKIRTVLSKYKRKDVYEKGVDYMHLNALIYAQEKPSNLDQIKIPFQNPDQLLEERKELVYQIEKKPKIKKNELEDLKINKQLIEDDSKQEQKLLENKNNKEEEIIDQDYYKKIQETKLVKRQQLIDKKNKDLEFLIYDQNMVIAYLVRKFPESYMIAKRLLHEINLKFPKFKPQKILDFGAGLSPTGHIFKSQYPECEIEAIEPNQNMKDLGQYLSKNITTINYHNNLFECLANQKITQKQQFDIVNCSFVLEEIKSSSDKIKVIESLWEQVKPEGFMIYVLPGTATGFRFLNDLRNFFISKDRTEANIIAPCPHQQKCPLASNKKEFCRFEQQWLRLPKNVFPKLERELNLIKSRFCYLIVKKSQIKSQEDPLITQSENSIHYHRIIQPVKRRGKQSHLRLCNNQGQIEYRIVTKSHGDTYGYRASKKLKWGDSWKYPLRLPNKYRKDMPKQKNEN